MTTFKSFSLFLCVLCALCGQLLSQEDKEAEEKQQAELQAKRQALKERVRDAVVLEAQSFRIYFDRKDSTFRIDDFSGRSVAVFASTLVAGGIVFLARWLSGPFEWDWGASQWLLLKSLIAAMASLLVFPFVDRMWAGYSRLVGEH